MVIKKDTMMTETNKCYSVDGETYNITDFGDLLETMDDPQVGDTYHEADAVPIQLEDAIHVDYILEQLDDWMYEMIGEYYDSDFYNVSDDAKKELELFLYEWALKHITAKYWTVRNSVEKQLTEDDLS